MINFILGALQSATVSRKMLFDYIVHIIKNSIPTYVKVFIKNKLPNPQYSDGEKLTIAKQQLIKDKLTIADIANLFQVENEALVLKPELEALLKLQPMVENKITFVQKVSQPLQIIIEDIQTEYQKDKSFFIANILSLGVLWTIKNVDRIKNELAEH